MWASGSFDVLHTESFCNLKPMLDPHNNSKRSPIRFIVDRCAVVAFSSLPPTLPLSPSPLMYVTSTCASLLLHCCVKFHLRTGCVSLMHLLSPSQNCLIMDDKTVARAETSAIWCKYVVCSGPLHFTSVPIDLPSSLTTSTFLICSRVTSLDPTLSFHLSVLQHLFSTSYWLLCSIFLSPSFHLLSSVKWERNELSWGAEAMRLSGLSQESDPNRTAKHTRPPAHTHTLVFLS